MQEKNKAEKNEQKGTAEYDNTDNTNSDNCTDRFIMQMPNALSHRQTEHSTEHSTINTVQH